MKVELLDFFEDAGKPLGKHDLAVDQQVHAGPARVTAAADQEVPRHVDRERQRDIAVAKRKPHGLRRL